MTLWGARLRIAPCVPVFTNAKPSWDDAGKSETSLCDKETNKDNSASMSKVKMLNQAIEACTKEEFDEIVKTYLRVVYDNQHIVVTDGNNDTGIDIKVCDYGASKVQYQLTTQKSSSPSERQAFVNKIKADIAKAKENAANYGWEPELHFFYSYNLTNLVIRKYELLARQQDVRLTIIDAKTIASLADDYPELQRIILSTTDGWSEFQSNSSSAGDERKNLLYDLVSFGAISNVKLQIVEAYILQCLYESDGLTNDEIAEACMRKFQSKENENFYKNRVNKLYSEEHVLTYSRETKKYGLTPAKETEIKRATEQLKVDEQYFFSRIASVLDIYQLRERQNDIISLLKDIYVNNFSSCIKLADAAEINGVSQLMTFLASCGIDEETLFDVIKELLQVCDDDKYLQRICASIVFSEKSNIDRLEQYAYESKKIYLDTSVALYLLCHHFNPHAKIEDDYKYTQSKLFIEYCHKKGVTLYLTNRYFGEVASHVEEALRLEPFTRIQNFRSLGGSGNVFFNHYMSLKELGDFDGSFREYLDELNFSNTDTNKTRSEYIKSHLKNIGVAYETIEQQYKYDETSKLISIELADRHRYKTPSALANDAIMLEFLTDDDISVHQVAPLFISWDKTLQGIMKQFYRLHPNGQRWIQLTPGQFVDRYSLLSCSVDQETITKNMLAMISETLVRSTHSLLDTLQMIVNPDDEVGLEYSNRFAKMRDSIAVDASRPTSAKLDDQKRHILDDVMFNITTHYFENPQKVDKYKGLFKEERHMEQLMDIIERSVLHYRDYQKLDESVYDELDTLMDER